MDQEIGEFLGPTHGSSEFKAAAAFTLSRCGAWTSGSGNYLLMQESPRALNFKGSLTSGKLGKVLVRCCTHWIHFEIHIYTYRRFLYLYIWKLTYPWQRLCLSLAWKALRRDMEAIEARPGKIPPGFSWHFSDFCDGNIDFNDFSEPHWIAVDFLDVFFHHLFLYLSWGCYKWYHRFIFVNIGDLDVLFMKYCDII